MIESSNRLAPTDADYDMDISTPASDKNASQSNVVNGLEKDVDKSHESSNMDGEDVVIV
jgi:hypothetical protein